jgi:chromosome segregation ATPase
MPLKNIETILEELVKRANEHSRRLRMLEERHRATELRVTSIEEALLKTRDFLREEMEKLNERIVEIERRLMRIENELERINKELGKTAKKAELKGLETMISFFNPLTTKFVTREEVERIVREMLEEREK